MIAVRGPLVTSDARHGDSIAVNGVCLTVVDNVDGGVFTADVMGETLRRSSLGALAAGRARSTWSAPPRVGSRLGGHLVQGHVDGVGADRSPASRPTHWEARALLAARRSWPGTWWRRARSPSTGCR